MPNCLKDELNSLAILDYSIIAIPTRFLCATDSNIVKLTLTIL